MQRDTTGRNFRSLLTRMGLGRDSRAALRAHELPTPGVLARMVGRALGISNARGPISLDALEARTMLEGSFASTILVTLDGTGRGGSDGVIDPAVPTTNNDFYSFVAPANDFVTILANTANQNPASSLNTRIRVYNSAQQEITTGNAGRNNGTLTSGLQNDGWFGFVATAGETYFAVVSSETATAGTYTIEVRAQSVAMDVGGETPEAGIGRESGSPIPDFTTNPPVLPVPILGQLGGVAVPVTDRFRQDEIVYKFTVPAGGNYSGLVTVNAQSTQTNIARRLDTRVEIYNAAGVLVASDSDAGRINDAFTYFRAEPSEIFYIRIRSDEVRNNNIELTTGPFFLVLDSLPQELIFNSVTRVTTLPGSFIGFDDPSVAPNPNVRSPTFQTGLFDFVAQGSGETIITVTPRGPLSPVRDPAVRLVDENGVLVAFNDNFSGNSSQIEARLIGGKRYFIIIDGFEVNSLTDFNLQVESNHTFDTTTPIDDHINTPALPTSPTPEQVTAARRTFERATGLAWGTPFATFDTDQNLVRDRSQRTQATGTGRIHRAGDVDLFQFTPQVDMLGSHAGNNDDVGTSLYVGGAFDIANTSNPFPTETRNLGIWDANDWWQAGLQFTDNGVTFGFNNNADTFGTDRAEIYALYDWDFDVSGGNGSDVTGVSTNILVVAGDFDLVIPTDAGPVAIKNLAGWGWDNQNQVYTWFDISGTLGTDGPVRAVTAYDPPDSFDPDGDSIETPGGPDDIESEEGPQLIIGGSFTTVGGVLANNIAQFSLVDGWRAMGAGVNGTVNALAVFDAPDAGASRAFAAAQPGPPAVPALPFIADPADKPLSLYIGGNFTSVAETENGGLVAANNLTSWNGTFYSPVASGRVLPAQAGDPGPNPNVPPFGGTEVTNGSTNGPVFALAVYDSPDPDGDGPQTAGEALYIGGQFTTIGGVAVQNLARWGKLSDPASDANDSTSPLYAPRLNFEAVNGVGPGTVFALDVWDSPAINNAPANPPFLVVGGDLTAINNLGLFNGDLNFAVGTLVGGTNGIVRAITSVVDAQEPSIDFNLLSGNPQEVLYIGGDFDQVDPNGDLNGPVDVGRVAQLSAIRGDEFVWSGLTSGVENQDPNAAPASVFALAAFDDADNTRWDRHDRPSARLEIVASPATTSFTNLQIRVFDSNFNVVYTNDNLDASPWSTFTGGSTFPFDTSRSGMIDPGNARPVPALNTAIAGLQVWGGETYYIEISGTGTGRYNLVVEADALPPDNNGDGTPDNPNTVAILDETNQGAFAQAGRIVTTLATGDGTIIRNAGAPPLKGNHGRNQVITPSLNAAYAERGDLGLISNIDDTDLYTFRAEFTGTAELRISTSALQDQFGEQIGNTFNAQTKTYYSTFDSAMRVFDNDFVQIAYNNDNLAVLGDREGSDAALFAVGANGGVFYKRDARVVINVIAGNNYFIQVESGQKWLVGAPQAVEDRVANIDREIDQRYVNGSYQLFVNQMPNQRAEVINGQPVLDDHVNIDNPLQATPVPISNAGTGSINGIIRNTPLNPNDSDQFRIQAPGAGQLRVALTRTSGDLNATVVFSDPVTGAILATGTPQGNGVVVTNITVQRGTTIIVNVIGSGGSQGGYRLDISGIPGVDDRADYGQWGGAQTIEIVDFLGQGRATGVIEAAGDTDIFRFSAQDFGDLSITLTSQSATLNPLIEVYEVSEDLSGRPVFLRVALNDDIGGGDINSQVSVTVSPDRRIAVQAPGVDRVYPFYYIVVRGSDINTDFGSYTVEINAPLTDDHPDGDTDGDGNYDTGEFGVATQLTLDPTTGQGSATGVIERTTDSDLFTFTAPASGTGSVTVSKPTGSLIRPRVTILDATGAILGQGLGGDDPIFFQANASAAVGRTQQYFVVVEGFDDVNDPNVNLVATGAYTLSVTAPPIDDHPNATEWTLASQVLLAPTTGRGQIGGDVVGDALNPRISPAGDTDLFTFTTLAAGNVTITVAPFDGPSGRPAPRLTIFDSSFNQIAIVSATSAVQTISTTITGAASGATYFVLVSAIAGIPASTQTGEYQLVVQGAPLGGGPIDNPGQIDFNNPTVLNLDPRTGDANRSDSIVVAGGRDLFTFTTLAAGRTFIQVIAPNGSLLDASVRVQSAANEDTANTVAFDSDGIPGASANLAFNALANTQYWVIVDGLNTTGSYTIRVNTVPAVNVLYFPEGFTNDNVREFLSIANPNAADVSYTVYLRYETGALETVVSSGVVRANSRDGLTISDVTNYRTPGVRADTPYSIIIESSAPIGATVAHYDFGNAVGDSMTERVAPTWNFARVQRSPGQVLDFVTFYNPNNFAVDVTLTGYDASGNPASGTFRVDALRRGGFAINDMPNMPSGVFGAVLTSAPVDSTFNNQFIGVVASLSHYELANDAAYLVFGDPEGGQTSGAITNVSRGGQVSSEVVFFNPGTTPVTVSYTTSYIRANLPEFTNTITLQPKQTRTITGDNLGIIPDQPVGIRYSASNAINVVTSQSQFGDADGSNAATEAGTRFFFGDAYLNTNGAGQLNFETLYFYNPANTASTINVRLLFWDQSTPANITVNINARGFAEVKLHERPEIINQRSGNVWFSVDASSNLPFVTTMTHYDLNIGGGWATTGSPFGLVLPISRIS